VKCRICTSLILLCGLVLSAYSQATTVDFKNLYFKEGLPLSGGSLDNSATMFDEYAMPVLQANSSTFLGIKSNSKLRIVGFTDNVECSGAACTSLSLRRAQLVYNWLLAHGLPTSKLLPPEGHGSTDFIDTNDTSDGRQRNRRVEFQIVSDPTQP
jgi:flagellar motor protein MotB